MSVRVLIADDHSVFRKLVRDLLESDDELEVVAEAGTGDELLRIAPTVSPDVVCLDLSMPGLNGLQATQALLAGESRMKVIVISGHADETYVKGTLDAGATGYVLKDDVGEHLIPAIRAVRRNEVYLCPQVAGAAAGGSDKAGAPQSGPPTRLESREQQVLQMMAEGCDGAKIAERLHASLAIVEVHCRNIMRKLDLHSRAELARYAVAYAGDFASDKPPSD